MPLISSAATPLDEVLDRRIAGVGEWLSSPEAKDGMALYLQSGIQDRVNWSLGYMAALQDLRSLIGFEGGSSAMN